MERSAAKINQIELLLTLDYLLNYTDKDHPATQQDICRHARDFGLKYDPKATSGNDVRRQRVGGCLQLLQYICYKFKDTDQIPFVINSTESGKFYVEKKNNLSEEQIIKILSAIKNDKYTKNEDTDFLINKLLDSLSNKYNRDFLKQEVQKTSKRVKKYSSTTNKKMNLVNKAYQEGKCILVFKSHLVSLKKENLSKTRNKHQRNSSSNFGFVDEKFYCRVYLIKELSNKPHAILIPLNKPGVIVDAIENLNIPIYLSERELLIDDFDDNRDFNKLFFANNKYFATRYKSLDEYIEKSVIPESGFAFKVSFYFNYWNIDKIKNSFEEYFSIKMPVIKCDRFEVDESQTKRDAALERPYKNDKFAIKCEPLSDVKTPKFGVVNIEINKNALISWILKNPEVAQAITVVSPYSVNKTLGDYALRMLLKYEDAVGYEKIQRATKVRHDYRWTRNLLKI